MIIKIITYPTSLHQELNRIIKLQSGNDQKNNKTELFLLIL